MEKEEIETANTHHYTESLALKRNKRYELVSRNDSPRSFSSLIGENQMYFKAFGGKIRLGRKRLNT